MYLLHYKCPRTAPKKRKVNVTRILIAEFLHFTFNITFNFYFPRGYSCSRHHESLFNGLLKPLRSSLQMVPREWRRTFKICRGACSEKTRFPFPFALNGIWSWWQFSFRFWTKWISIWFKIEMKTVTTIISHSMRKEMEI